jgi:CBS domain containing-hemolysin-like protein
MRYIGAGFTTPMEPHSSGLGAGAIAVRLAVAFVLVLANAFFVAAEFALVGARRTRIEALAREGKFGARTALVAIRQLDRTISATQLGITMASLGLGWVGESTLAAVIASLFAPLPEPWSVVATHTVAGTLAFAFITVLHIVLGELAPKSLALLFPETVSLWTAPPLLVFTRLFSPFIVVLNGSANLLLRALGLRPPRESERVHRPEEIELLLVQSVQHGLLDQEPVEMIRGVFDLSETTAAEVMTPRTEIVAIDVRASVAEAAEAMLRSGHSRLPVYDGTIDHIVGVVLARDVWRAEREGKETPLTSLVHPVMFVPETKPVEDLLREMQRQRIHMAIVLDEYGGTAGLVTLEDLLEEIVGDIQDEHEQEEPEIAEAGGEVVLSGCVPIAEVNERFGLRLPDDEFTTVAGLVMGLLGRIGREGEEVEWDGVRFRILRMSGKRIDRVALRLLPAEEEHRSSEPVADAPGG